ncbi:hypothetical protein OF83DRAFT_1288593 [Amylostereum chailletii]|nr:hypothetical protein OF83DRAFT_1288593 [Amylostereum chailletii]
MRSCSPCRPDEGLATFRRTGSGRDRAAREKKKIMRRKEDAATHDHQRQVVDASHRREPLVDIARISKKQLTTSQRRARLDIQAHVQIEFRALTGVAVNKIWPIWEHTMAPRKNPENTEEVYYTPNFEMGLLAKENRELLQRVGDVVMQNLKLDDKMGRPSWAADTSFRVDHAMIVTFAKTTFEGYKREFKSQRDVTRHQQTLLGAQNTRRGQRRTLKAKHRLLAVPAYLKIYGGPDPTPFVTPDTMSDEASCAEGYTPENEPELATWKIDMAKLAFSTLQTPDTIEKLKMFEIIRPNWRSELDYFAYGNPDGWETVEDDVIVEPDIGGEPS